MVLKKIAIFVDWENIRLGVFKKSGQILPKQINFNSVDNILKFIYSFIDSSTEGVYRIFFYLTDPFGGTINTTDYSKTPTFKNAVSLIEKLAVTDYIALRKGILVFRGFDNNNKPIFVQKKVDMLIGLDIAHVSYNRLADRVLILSADTDIVPAMKTARINGLQVVLGFCSDAQTNISREMKEHSDIVRDKPLSHIFP